MTILMLEMTCEICRVNLKISLSHIGLLERSIEQMNHFLRLAEGHHFLLFSADIATYIQGIFDKEWCFQCLRTVLTAEVFSKSMPKSGRRNSQYSSKRREGVQVLTCLAGKN